MPEVTPELKAQAEQRMADMDALLDGVYEDEGERKLARETLAQEIEQDLGVNPLKLDDGTPEGGEGGDDAAAEAAKKAAEDAAAAEAAKKAGEGADKGGEGGKEGEGEPSEADKRIAALEAQLADERRQRIEAEAKITVSGAGDKIRDAAVAALATKKAEFDALDVEADAKATKFEEEYGAEAAAAYRQIAADAKAGRASQYETLLEQEVERRTAAFETVTQAETTTAQDIASVPDLKKWHDEAQALPEGKTSPMWTIAVGVDTKLRADPEWASKPQAERFAEVARQVNTMVGALDPENPGSKSDDDIKKEIDAKKGKGDNAPPLGSLSDLAGGDAGKNLTDKLEDMSTTDLTSLMQSGRMSMEKLDELMAKTLPDSSDLLQ